MRCDNAKHGVGDLPTLGVCPGGVATTKVTLTTKGGRKETHHFCRACTHAFWKRYAWERGQQVDQEPLAIEPGGKKVGFWEYVFGKASKRIFPY